MDALCAPSHRTKTHPRFPRHPSTPPPTPPTHPRHGALLLPDGGGGLEGHTDHDRLPVGDPALDAPGPVRLCGAGGGEGRSGYFGVGQSGFVFLKLVCRVAVAAATPPKKTPRYSSYIMGGKGIIYHEWEGPPSPPHPSPYLSHPRARPPLLVHVKLVVVRLAFRSPRVPCDGDYRW